MPQRSRAPRRPSRSRIAWLLAALVSTLVAAPAASAGSYRIWSCNTPAGAPTSVEGWTANVGAPYSATGDNCSKGAGLDMLFGFQDGVTYGGGQGVTWKFTAPPNTLVGPVSYVQNRGVNANGADLQASAGAGVYRGEFIYDGDHLMSLCRSVDCTGTAEQRIAFDAGGRPSWGFDAGCYGPANDPNVHCAGSSGAPRAFNSAKQIAITLIDNANPTASDPGGTILDPGTKSGKETITFKAADVGGGVWNADVKLGDTIVTPRTVIDTNGGRCAEVDVEPQFGNEFGYPVPCKTSTVTANLEVPTTAVPNGTYVLTATVYDVAYNATTVISRKVTIDNGAAGEATKPPAPGGPGGSGTPGLPNGTGGVPASGKITGVTAPKDPARFGKPLSLAGKVVDAAGTPLAGAFVDVYTTVAVPGAARVFAGTLTADADGAFSYGVSTRASQAVEFAYSPKQASTDYVDQVKVDVAVKASVSLALVKRARRGRAVKFTGAIGVDPLPKKGARIVIESKVGKRWITAKVLRTTQNGLYSWTHRFKTRGRYVFRTRLYSASDVPAKRNQSVNRSLRIS